MKPDRRLTPARPDLAARHLAGSVQAERFADPAPHRVTAATVPMRARPDAEASLDTELLHGEAIAVYDVSDGWAWGQAELDGYVGYVPASALGPAEGPAPTHRVGTQWATLYARPALKSPPASTLPFGARVRLTEEKDGFALTARGWIAVQHLAPLDAPERDWVAVAERFLGTPYVWGGRSPAGLDCSALVQLSRQSAGHACPRDSDMQEATLGRGLGADIPLRRGDLVFWRGHVAVMIDESLMVHANGHHMAVAIEPFSQAVARIEAAGGGPVTRHARLDGG